MGNAGRAMGVRPCAAVTIPLWVLVSPEAKVTQ